MPLDATDLATLSRLLDEALDLAPDKLEPWLAALPPDQQRLRPPLQEMLARHAAPAHAGFLADGPRLDGEASDPSGPRAGERIGPYVLIRELGHGGMGTVWLAVRADGTLKREVALKLPRLAWGPGLARRMARERDIVARLAHPNIARLYDAGLDDQGRPYLALEFIDGQPIDTWCEARALPLRERLALVVQVARAVGHAHGSLVVHRDLKPSNILVTQDGEVHLLDFGIAKLLETTEGPDGDATQTQARLLTPRYASPEQADGRPITVASDVYSLGVVLHQLLTGSLPSLPSPNDDPAPASRSVVNRGAARALRGDLDAIVGKALRHDPARRYATMEAFANDLENHLAGRPVQARPDGTFYIAGRFARRHWFGLAAATAICVAIVAGGATAIVQARHAAREAERARAATEFVAELFRLNTSGPDATGTAATPTELIDRGASLIQARFAGQPEMQAQLLGAVGQAYEDMGANALAADYAVRRLQILQQLPDTREQQVDSLLLESNARLHDDDNAAAEASARQALELVGSQADLRLDALAALARAQVAGSRMQQAAQTVRQGEALLQAVPRLDGSVAATHLLAAQAMLLGAEGRPDEAKPLIERTVALALRNEGTGSRTAEDLLYSSAMTLLSVDAFDDGRQAFERAMAILRQRDGKLARAREAVRAATFWSYAQERSDLPFPETLAKVQASHDALNALGSSVLPIVRARVDFEVGSMYLEWADVQKALAWLEPSTKLLLAAKPSLRMRLSILGINAELSRLLGRDAEALEIGQERLRLRQQIAGPRNPQAALSYAQFADELVWQGQPDRAEAMLDAMPPLTDSAFDKGTARYTSLLRVMIAVARQDARAAARLLFPLENMPGPERAYTMSEFGNVLCQTGEHAHGLAMMLDAIRYDLETKIYAYDADLAFRRSRAGLCALMSGRRALAAQCALLARRAFDEQPLIGPRYQAPLLHLEDALRLQSAGSGRAGAAPPKPATNDDRC